MTDQIDAYMELATRHGFSSSKRYRRILEMLMPPEEAKLVTLLPGSPEKLAEATGMATGIVKHHLEELFRKGVIIPRIRAGGEEYTFCESAELLHDATLTCKEMDHLEASAFFALWNQFCHQEWYPAYAKHFATMERPQERVVPAYQAIKDLDGVLPHEDIREIFKSNPLIATVPCTCRRREQKCGKPLEVCLQFGPSAEYAMRRGSGRRLSFEEAMTLADLAEEAGLVHGWANTDTLNSHCMCNCCNDCCIAMVPLLEHRVPLGKRVAKSRFDAEVDPKLCEGCQVCVDRCPFDAIALEQAPGNPNPTASVDLEKCLGCGVCVLKCESRALSLVLVRPPEHIPKASST